MLHSQNSLSNDGHGDELEPVDEPYAKLPMVDTTSYCDEPDAGIERIKATSALLSRVFILVSGIPPFCIWTLWCFSRFSSTDAGRMEAVPDRPGAATVPCSPSTPWQVSQRSRSKSALPCTASAISGTGLTSLGASAGLADWTEADWVP